MARAVARPAAPWKRAVPAPGHPPVRPRAGIGSALVVLVWIPSVLLLDTGASLGQQRLLGLATWLLLAVLLLREDPLTRLQVGVVVGYATLVELIFSGLLGTYVYRLDRAGAVTSLLDRVPAFVPPGHGLVYLAAVVLGRRVPVWTVHAAMLGVAGYAVWGLVFSPQLDVLGALWAVCLLWFLARGRAPRVYASAFVVITFLEVLGTSLGTWRWGAHDPVLGWIAIGNPPSGAAGGYCFFDAAALALAPLMLGWLRRGRPGRAAVPGP